MSLLGWRQWAVDRGGLLRPAWTPWSPHPSGLLLWRPDGLTRAHCLRDPAPFPHDATGGPSPRPPQGSAVTHAGPGTHDRPGTHDQTRAHQTGTHDQTGGHDQTGTQGRTGGRDEVRAADEAGAGVVPDEKCACGLYAWRDPAELARAPYPRWTSLPIVVGAVRLGGRIIVGERGYRAEVGYPVAVLDPRGVVAAAYPVARYRDWRALVSEWLPEAPPAAA